MFGVVPKTLWNRKFPCDNRNRVSLACNCYLIESEEHSILIETACGDKIEERARERLGLVSPLLPLPDLVAAAGKDPERIDMVVNSHLHWDHCGGNTVRTGGKIQPAFPRATYYTRRGEWEHAHERHVRDSVSYIDDNYDPLVESGRMCLLDRDTEVAPGIRLQLVPGHNRDMMIITAQSGGECFCFFSDLVPTATHLTPTWIMAFDLSPLETIDNKILWLGRAARENWWCGFAHDPTVDFARVAPAGNKFELAG